MTLDELITFCVLQGDNIETRERVHLRGKPVLPTKTMFTILRSKGHKRIATIEYREGMDRKAIEKCDMIVNTRSRGRLVFPDITFEKLVQLYLNEDLV